jgi:23S rRNA (cytosine1962-C5)-methyltransferase
MQEEVKTWADYELLDTGSGEKLERFGPYILRRPEPQAIWPKALPEKDWEAKAHASFFRSKGNPESGNWISKPGMPERWFCRYERGDLKLQYKLALSSFKHVGIFPEQSANWDFLFSELKRISSAIGEKPKVLNLFAYTGIASLAACAAGAQVTHVDAVKQVVGWARENMEASSLDGIRWLADDALKFVKREERRGNRYHCLILDPPAYGRGPEGEKWLLEEQLPELLASCRNILEEKNHCIILNLYSMGYSSLIAENLLRTYFPESETSRGEFFFTDEGGRKLPLGIYSRSIA